jgi:hypothetical protein
MMRDDDEPLEFAMLRYADGRPVSRPSLERDAEAFRAALRKTGGRPPIGRNGRRQPWNRSLDGMTICATTSRIALCRFFPPRLGRDTWHGDKLRPMPRSSPTLVRAGIRAILL